MDVSGIEGCRNPARRGRRWANREKGFAGDPAQGVTVETRTCPTLVDVQVLLLSQLARPFEQVQVPEPVAIPGPQLAAVMLSPAQALKP